MIHRENWYREADDRSLVGLEKKIDEGSLEALEELGKEYRRFPRRPTLRPETWAAILPYLAQRVREEAPEEIMEWAMDFMWMASHVTGILPDVPKSATQWIPVGYAPKIIYRQSWEVLTEGSTQAGDYEDLGMISEDGEKISYRNTSPEILKDYNFNQEKDLDDFLQDMEFEGYSDQEGYGGLSRILDREEAQEEFDDTYNEGAYGDEVDDYYGESLSTVIGGKFEIHFELEQQGQQIMKWLKE